MGKLVLLYCIALYMMQCKQYIFVIYDIVFFTDIVYLCVVTKIIFITETRDAKMCLYCEFLSITLDSI